MNEKIAILIEQVRKNCPLVHNITNYVTVNDCANAVLAIGASPIMADDISEAADIASISSAVVINIGTLNKRTIESMLAAAKRANELNIPVVLDPVGAGASSLRNETVNKLLNEIKFSIIRGNLSEMSYIAGISSSTKGVDSSEKDSKNDAVYVACCISKKYNCVAAITGAVDVVADNNSENIMKISNGHAMLSKVTGTGCMTSSLIGSFAGAVEDKFLAAVAAIASMGIAGEIAYKNAGEIGTGSFHIAVIDALSKLDEPIIKEMIKIEQITG